MTMQMPIRFMVVDDDIINNMICMGIINNRLPDIEVITFQYPAEALEFIENEIVDPQTKMRTILLLDINMPIISGWEFLQKFENFDVHIKENYTIYILSSSISEEDHSRAAQNLYVKTFHIKPFSPASLLHIIADFQ